MRFVVEAVRGFQLAFHGAAFLWQHRLLWKWAILPVMVNVVVFTAASALFLRFYSDLSGLALSGEPPPPTDVKPEKTRKTDHQPPPGERLEKGVAVIFHQEIHFHPAHTIQRAGMVVIHHRRGYGERVHKIGRAHV